MPLPDENIEEKQPEELKPEPPKSSLNMKLLLFGLPAFIIQVIIIYFVTANILIKKFEDRSNPNAKTEVKSVSQKDTTKNEPQVELGKFIYSIDDIIINPANTDGKRLLLTNVGFDVSKADMIENLKTREAMVKDAVISTLSSKDIVELNNTSYRDTLKMEISGRLKKLIPDVKINKIYFSKYIIQ